MRIDPNPVWAKMLLEASEKRQELEAELADVKRDIAWCQRMLKKGRAKCGDSSSTTAKTTAE